MEQLFGPNVKKLIASDPPALPNEKELLNVLIEKVGPFADKHKLLYHIRVSAGKVHWAVNSYFRSILAVAGPARNREDFDSKPRHARQLSAQRSAADAGPTSSPQLASAVELSTGSEQADFSMDASHATATLAHEPAEASHAQVSLDGLPTNILESIMLNLDIEAVLCAASSCKALYRAAQAERIWQNLFWQQWGSAIFPTSKHSSNSNTPGSRSRAAPHAPDNQPSSSGAGIAMVAAGIALASRSVAQIGHDQAAVTCPARVESSQQVVGVAPCSAGHPRVSLFDAAVCESSATALLRAPSSGSTPAVTKAVQSGQPSLLPPSASSEPAPADSGSSSSRFVRRWTGSCLPPKCGEAATSASPAGTTSSTQRGRVHGSSSSYTCTCHKQQEQQQPQMYGRQSCCGSCYSMLPQRAPAGSWKAQYKQQYSYQSARRCPKCGDAFIVPIVYGFPSAPLLAGMNSKRLVLGGDHLIEACHVWACSGCRSCFRYFPYTAVHLWLQDDEAQQRLDQARAAAGRGSRRGSVGDGDLQAEGQLQLPGDEEAAAAGMPRYTYEL